MELGGRFTEGARFFQESILINSQGCPKCQGLTVAVQKATRWTLFGIPHLEWPFWAHLCRTCRFDFCGLSFPLCGWGDQVDISGILIWVNGSNSTCPLALQKFQPPFFPGPTAWEHLIGPRIPKGKMKASQNPAQDKGQAGKCDLQASHHVFPQ